MGFGRTDETRSRSREFVGLSSCHAWTVLTNVPSTPPPITEGFGIGLQLCFSDAGECHPPAILSPDSDRLKGRGCSSPCVKMKSWTLS